MATFPAGFEPLPNLQTDQTKLVRRVQFGDGYRQLSINSVNPQRSRIMFEFIVKTNAELNTLLDFLNDNLTVDYQLPNEGSASTYDITNVSVSYIDKEFRKVSVDTERVY